MNEKWNKIIKVIIMIVIIFVDLMLVSSNSGTTVTRMTVNRSELIGEYVNNGIIYNLFGQSILATVIVISLIISALTILVYRKEFKEMLKTKIKMFGVAALLIFDLFILNYILIHLNMITIG